MERMLLRNLAILGKSGSGGSGIGKLSRFEKKTLTFPDAKNGNAWSEGAIVPCSFEPKIVIFYCSVYESGIISEGVAAFNYDPNSPITKEGETYSGCAVAFYKNPTTGNLSAGAFNALAFDGTNHSTGAARIQYYNNTLYFSRHSNGVIWSNTETYTFEIYG